MAIIEAQRMELRDRFARMQEKHDFKPGDIIRQKRGLQTCEPMTGDAYVFVQYFDRESPAHMLRMEDDARRMIMHPLVDCFIGTLSPGEKSVLLILVPSCMFEPDPGAVL